MNFIFASTSTFEPWDWTNPETQGIGGSETSHIEMARRLSEHGHVVYSYSPTPGTKPVVGPGGVLWDHIDNVDLNKKGVWVVYRDPDFAARIPRDGNVIWLICQDVDYNAIGGKLGLNHITSQHLDRIVTLCPDHGRYMKIRHKEAVDKVCVSSNGIKVEVIDDVLNDPPKRNPRRLIYASSPDRGLLSLLAIFQRAREIVTDLELHVYYGFDNIQKIIDKYGEGNPTAQNARRVQKALRETEGVEWHGRIGQTALAREWAMSGIWCHPSIFTETSCITCMDAQALGAIPITTPLWAVKDNVQHGVFIDGDAQRDPLTRARYVLELIRLAQDEERQEKIRAEMMPWAKAHFSWERFVDQWEGWAKQDTKSKSDPWVVSNAQEEVMA